MAGKIRSLLSSIARKIGLRPKAPKPPRIGGVGHGGVAAGDLAERETGEKPYTTEELARWRELSYSEVEAFIHEQSPLYVNSSNVAFVQYHKDEEKMMVEFLNGSAYLYSSVSPKEALEFAQAQSKGGFVWSRLRVRGSKTAHRKPYSRIR